MDAFPSDLRLGYLGPPIDHLDNLARLVGSAGGTLHVMQDSISWGVYGKTQSLWSIPSRWRSQMWGTGHRGYVQSLVNFIDHNGVNCVLAYWGTRILGDVIALKRSRPGVKVILNVLCHPTALEGWKIAAQNWYFRRCVEFLDGIIVPSEAMRTYLERAVLRGRAIPCLVSPPCYSREFFPSNREACCPTVPNILFLGRMDWRQGQKCDNVDAFLRELLDAGVHVYHHDFAESLPPHPNRHTFGYMPLAEIEAYAAQFDASLVYYNLDGGSRRDRFEVTVPDRLVASVVAGIPVALPAQGYAASKAYLNDYPAVIEFDSASALAERLKDRAALEQLRQTAQASSVRYVAERQLDPLVRFIHQITTQPPHQP